MKKRNVIIFISVVGAALVILGGILAPFIREEIKYWRIKNIPDSNVHMNVIIGEVVEIEDANRITIQITEERGGYSVDEQVMIEYDIYWTYETDENGELLHTEAVPKIGDIATLQFWDEDVQKQGTRDLIIVDEVANLPVEIFNE